MLISWCAHKNDAITAGKTEPASSVGRGKAPFVGSPSLEKAYLRQTKKKYERDMLGGKFVQ